jgi:hypothetical protein
VIAKKTWHGVNSGQFIESFDRPDLRAAPALLGVLPSV